MPYRVCFVCSGNICRSPMAEFVFRERVREAGLERLIEVDSAGTGDWHEGADADHRTLSVLRAAGYELPGDGPGSTTLDGPGQEPPAHQVHVARQFQRSWFPEIDVVVALDSGHLRALRRLAPTAQDAAKVRLLRSYDPAAGSDPDVPDPYYGGIDGFETCLEMVEAASEGLLDAAREAAEGRAA